VTTLYYLPCGLKRNKGRFIHERGVVFPVSQLFYHENLRENDFCLKSLRGEYLLLMGSVFWWIKQALLVIVGSFFLIFGIQLLTASYRFNDPFSFIMTFFASNFIILISATLVIGFICRIIKAYRERSKKTGGPDG